MLQRLDSDRPAGAHLDISCVDTEATADWHVALGAKVIERFEHWIVMADPTGERYCLCACEPFDG
ncbi:hypothetical protein GCM10023318_31740 [Nocardia callitridis]|uniref:Glyoxalase-like domain-containing protein n=1 Tax=Nocardia callitridis TaxID=648753 RepID=A0ABP9KBP4_9NOCA